MSERVRVNSARAQLFEHFADGAFAAAEVAGKSDQVKTVHGAFVNLRKVDYFKSNL